MFREVKCVPFEVGVRHVFHRGPIIKSRIYRNPWSHLKVISEQLLHYRKDTVKVLLILQRIAIVEVDHRSPIDEIPVLAR